jgi:hypothetical protein
MAHGDRSVDVFIRKVRQKLEKASPDWAYIHTHFGVGYRFDPERSGEPDQDEPPQDEAGGDNGTVERLPARAPVPDAESIRLTA